MMMKMLLAQFAPFLSFFITTQDLNSHTVIIFSGAALPRSKCLDIRDPVDRLTNGTIAQMLVDFDYTTTATDAVFT
jgi:hypothetical protein